MTFTFMPQPLRMFFLACMASIVLTSHVVAAENDPGGAVTVTGELELLYLDDFENKRFELQYFIKDMVIFVVQLSAVISSGRMA